MEKRAVLPLASLPPASCPGDTQVLGAGGAELGTGVVALTRPLEMVPVGIGLSS